MGLFIDNFEIGKGVNPNLLIGTRDWSGKNWSTAQYLNFAVATEDEKYLDFSIVKQYWKWFGIGQYLPVAPNEIYTLSAYVKGTNLKGYAVLGNNESEHGYSPASISNNGPELTTDNWTRYTFTFKTLSSGYIHPRFENDQRDLQIAGMKLERGSVATDWCPNYADYAMQSDISSLTAAVEALKNKMGGVKLPTISFSPSLEVA